jgi:predicted nuclease with TOPRIM domain
MEVKIEHRLTELESRTKSNTHRLDEVEKRQGNLDDLVGTVKALAVREENVENDVKEIKSDVKSLTSKPGQRWDALVDKIILTIAAAVIGFILAKMGIGA